MKTHRGIKFFLLVAALAIAVIGMEFTSEPAQAHTACKVRLPGGGWIEGCPHPHVPRVPTSSPSCLAVMTDTYYEFRISNQTGHKVNYSINGKGFSLSDGYGRNHKYQKAYGTNSCNVKRYRNPIIKFDYSYQSGYQERSYRLGNYKRETFRRSGYGVDLYH